MSFIQPKIYKGAYYSVETTNGTEIIPLDVSGIVQSVDELTDYLEGKPLADHPVYGKGWLARMSAPGYLDCTPWSAYDTEEEAQEALMEYYGDDENE